MRTTGQGSGMAGREGSWGCGPLASLAAVRAARTLTYNGSPRRNGDEPHLSASGTPSPNPCQGPPPLDPAVLFSWSTGVAPRYPPANDGPDPGMTLDTGGGGPRLPIPSIQV